LEEDEATAAPDGKVFGENSIYEGEIEHIYYFSVEEGPVTAFGGKETGDFGYARFAEDEAVKCTVYDVAYGSHKYKGKSYENPHRGVRFFKEFADVPNDENTESYAKKAENEFARLSAKDHTEGHPFVFHEIDLEPVAKYVYALVKGKMGFNPDLGDLIQNEDEGNDDRKDFASGQLAFAHGRDHSRLFFASTDSVA